MSTKGACSKSTKMYLAGISQAFRSAVVLIVFSIVLFITRNLGFSCIVMAVVAAASLLVLTIPLAYMETPKSRRWDMKGVINLFKRCFPVFVALFLYCLIDNMPKFMMEGPLSYDNQLYFNVLYFPAQGILLTASLLYKPLLLRLAAAWENPDERRTFNIIMMAVFGAIIAITVFNLIIMNWIGVPIMSVLYNTDFEQFRVLMNLMIVAGGITAAIDFIYQIITGSAPPEQRREALPHHVCVLARCLVCAHQLHRSHGRSHHLSGRDVPAAYPDRAAVREHQRAHAQASGCEARELQPVLGVGMAQAQAKIPVLLMVSGGSDSTALLELVCTYAAGERSDDGLFAMLADSLPAPDRIVPFVLHVNHMLRGEDSDGDERFVRELCEKLDVPCEVQRVDVGALARSRRGGMEAIAREERYRLASSALDRVCARVGAKDGLICTAHTIDDRVETFFMRALVGTGPGGLASIPRVRGQSASSAARRIARAAARLAEEASSRCARYCALARGRDESHGRQLPQPGAARTHSRASQVASGFRGARLPRPWISLPTRTRHYGVRRIRLPTGRSCGMARPRPCQSRRCVRSAGPWHAV